MEKISYPFDSEKLIRNKKKLLKSLGDNKNNVKIIKIALLGGSTIGDISDFLRIFLLNERINPIFYESDYGQYYEEVMYNNQQLIDFNPDVVFIHTSIKNINHWPNMKDSDLAIDQKLDYEYTKLHDIWVQLKSLFECMIIQNNFERPIYQLLGNKDVSSVYGASNFVARLNMKIYDYIQKNKNVFIHDVEGLSSKYGLEKWQEAKYWNNYRYAMNINAIPEFSYSLSAIIKSYYGRNIRGIIVDADNTLWGGVVGEEGPQNILIGNDTPEGTAFKEWQKYLKSLSQLGIVLLVATKNNKKDFENGLLADGNVLCIDDFEVVAANWNRKDLNIEQMVEELNLSVGQFLFVDDNPVERELVKDIGVICINASKPSEFISYIDRARYFENTQFTAEDIDRKDLYKRMLKRTEVKRQFTDYDAYLKNLKLRANFKLYKNEDTERIVQLINKSNQFNMTTVRLSRNEFVKKMNSDNQFCLYGQLEDKYGDYGIVSISVFKIEEECLDIELFLMSCRAIKKTLEKEMLAQLIAFASSRGCTQVRGQYRPTDRNKLVEKFYCENGFEIADTNDLRTLWTIDVENYKRTESVMTVKMEESNA